MSTRSTASSPWLPVVWGRTLKSDKWWRVRPAGTESHEWLRDLAKAACAGGKDVTRPRFLLARSHDHWVTGVACLAADLDASMSVDEHGRELYTFVGWIIATPEIPALPSLADWQSNYVAWAGPTYSEWCRLEWTNHYMDTAGKKTSEPVEVRWGPAPSVEPTALPENPVAVLLFPEPEAEAVWASGAATTSPFTLVTGWRNTDLIDASLVSHATVQSIAEPLTVARRERSSRDGRAPAPVRAPVEGRPTTPGDPPAVPADFPDAAAGTDRAAADQSPARRGLFDRLTGATADAEIRMLRDEVSRLRFQIDRLSDLPAQVDRLRQSIDDLVAHQSGTLLAEPIGEDVRGREE
jgi:hypothetical protein